MANRNSNSIFLSYDNVLDNIVCGVSCDWLYEAISRSESSPAALREIFDPIDDEITCGCFLMDLVLTYDGPDYTAVEPGQVITVDMGIKSQLFIVDSLIGAITINDDHIYEKGFLLQRAAINQDSKATYSVDHQAFVVGYPDRDRDDFELVNMITGEQIPAFGFALMKDVEIADCVKESIRKGINDTIVKMVAGIPAAVTSIYNRLQPFKPFIHIMNDGFSNMKGAREAVQDQLQSLKEGLELLMVALAEDSALGRLTNTEGN